MPTPWKRDLEADGLRLKNWLEAKLPGATEVAMSELVAPGGSGFSNETLLFDLAWREGGERCSEKMVVRIQPTGYQVFPEYDLGTGTSACVLAPSQRMSIERYPRGSRSGILRGGSLAS